MSELSLIDVLRAYEAITYRVEEPAVFWTSWNTFAWTWCELEGLEGIEALAALCGQVPWIANGDEEAASRMYAWIVHKATA